MVALRALRTRAEFSEVFSEGTKWRGKNVSVRFVLDPPSALDEVRLGMAVSRRFGNAVHRNLFRRRLREVFRCADLPPGSYLVSPRRSCDQITFAGLKEDITRLGVEGLGRGLKKVIDGR